MIWRSLRSHALSSALAVVSIAAGVSLLVSVTSLREQAHRTFTQEGLGVDAILGPKGSPLQIVLNAVYHLEEMPGKVPWTYYRRVLENPVVESGIPFVTGHSYGGFRVNAIDGRFLTEFQYEPGMRFSFRPEDGGRGRPFNSVGEAVAGWSAARSLRIQLGQTFNPVCGVRTGDPVHANDEIRFVGILAPTGTPHDRAIYIPLENFYTLEGHGANVQKMAVDEGSREISGALLRIKRIRGGAIHPGVQDLAYGVNQSTTAQIVRPAEVLPRLYEIIGWTDRVLFAIAVMVTALAGLFLFAALTSALEARRRDLALLRAVGAGRRTVFGLVVAESVVITLAGGVLGTAVGHALVALGSHFVRVETGVRFSAMFVSSADLWLAPVMFFLGAVAGLLPAVRAYRLDVIRTLVPTS
jgi:putative ABC transport system permease protein